MDNLNVFKNDSLNLKVRALLNDDGSISINAEDTAIGFGWTETKDNKEYIRWRTLNSYLAEFGFSQQVAKDDYIPESLFYLLGMKANNKIALDFQRWLATEVLPFKKKEDSKNMNNNLMIFQGHEVEVIELNGQVLFNPKHVAECLEITDVKSSIRNFNDNQMVKLTNSKVHTMHFRKLHNTGENFLTESGVYKLVFKSRKPDAEKFTDWIADEVLPALRKTGTYSMKDSEQASDSKSKLTEAKLINAKVRMSNQLLKLSNIDTLSTEYKNILVSKATEVLTGETLIPLPKSNQKTYSATDIGKMFNVSASVIGTIANQNGLKTKKYGEYYRDKSLYSSKEIDVFRYYDSAIPEFKRILEMIPKLIKS